MSAPERVYRAGDGTLLVKFKGKGLWGFDGEGLRSGGHDEIAAEAHYGPLRPQVVLDEDKVRALREVWNGPLAIRGGSAEDMGRLLIDLAPIVSALLASIPSVEDDPK